MISPPHYLFHFDDNNAEVYALWISLPKDKIELVTRREPKYVQLTEKTSAQLFEIITDKKLTDVQ